MVLFFPSVLPNADIALNIFYKVVRNCHGRRDCHIEPVRLLIYEFLRKRFSWANR